MRIMSVIGALALACLCLASPSIAASPGDHLTFDVIGHELAVASTPAELADVDVFDITAPSVDFAVPIVADLPGAGDDDVQPIATLCPIDSHVTSAPVLLRIDDVGWCLS